jgi:pyrroloquinoline-quinone synthase
MPQTADTFLKELKQIIQERKYSRHSFIRDLGQGKFTQENLRRWAIQKYFQVDQHIRAFGGIYANCPDRRVRRLLVENLIEEETDLRCGSDSHAALMLRFAKALGATNEEVEKSNPVPEVADYVDWVIKFCQTSPYIVGLAALSLAGESQVPEAMRAAVQGLKEHYRMSDAEIEFFIVHIGGDEEHSHIAETLVKGYATTDELQTQVREAVATFCDKWWRMQDGYYRVAAGLDQNA